MTLQTSDSSLAEQLLDIDHKTWTPERGTFGAALALRAKGHSRAAQLRYVRTFARTMVRVRGLWWAQLLDASPSEVPQSDRAYAVQTFDEWLQRRGAA